MALEEVLGRGTLHPTGTDWPAKTPEALDARRVR